MNDDNEVQATEEEVKEATALGWSPKDKWRGPEDAWLDVKPFLEKGRYILPIVTERNKKLEGQVTTLGTRLAQTEEALRVANAAIEAIQESQEADTKAQVEEARAKLKEELEAASREGDHAGVADLTDKLTQLNSASADDDEVNKGGKGDKGGKGNKSEDNQVHPLIIKWFKENPDFATDRRRVALATVVARELREEGEAAIGGAFMDLVAARVEDTLGPVKKKNSKAEAGGGSNGGGGGGGGGGKTYADLPADAKAACDRQGQRLVGPNRAHKDIESWRKSYARQYFKE